VVTGGQLTESGRRIGVRSAPGRFVVFFLPDVKAARPLAVATLVNNLGSGLSVAVMPLYLTQVAGLSPAQVGLGLGAGALAGMTTGIPAGMLADRVGPKGMMVGLIAGMGLVMLGFQFIHSMGTFVLFAVLDGALDRGVATVAGAIVAGAVTRGAARVEVRSALRVALNLGLTAGGALSAVALSIGTESAYRVVLLIDALTYFAAASCYLGLRVTPPAATAAEAPTTRVRAVRDVRYVRTTLLMAVLQMRAAVMTVALPLWVVNDTSVPKVMIAVVTVVNTVGLFALQAPAGRRVTRVRTALRAAALSGTAFLLACCAFAMSGRAAVWLSVVALVIASLFFLFGELMSSTTQFCLAYELAPEHAQGEYQGVFQTVMASAMAIAPTVVVALVIDWGGAGWLVIGGVFAVAGVLVRPAVVRGSSPDFLDREGI
jgi:MFS family permease